MSEDLKVWMSSIRTWAVAFSRRRRRPDLAEDIESAAIEIMLTLGRVGAQPGQEIESRIARELELGDSFSTARDSDLTAAVNDQSDRESVGSFLGELVSDGTSEDTIIAQLDGEQREEGQDRAEVIADIEEEEALIPADECTALDLKVSLGFKQKWIASFMGVSQGHVSRLLKRARRRREDRKVLEGCLAQYESDPDFSKLEVQWIRI